MFDKNNKYSTLINFDKNTKTTNITNKIRNDKIKSTKVIGIYHFIILSFYPLKIQH
jgi:hypothetical protein